MRHVSSALASVSVGLLVLSLGACEKRREPTEREAEQASREIERQADEAGRKAERGLDAAGEKAEDMARDTGEAARDVGHDVKEGSKELARDAGDAAKRGAHEVGEAGERAGENIKEGVNRAGERAERAIEPETTTGEVGAEAGGLTGAERMAQATSDTADRVNSCDLDKPLNFFFKPESTNVAGDQLTRANQLAKCLKERPDNKVKITVVSFGDTGTDTKRNVETGLKRANNVAQILIRNGAPPQQVVLQSMGDTLGERTTGGPDRSDWARRIEVRIVK
jgi:ankyrin